MIKVTLTTKNGYARNESWQPTSLFCPNCGKQRVYEESGEGDYYVGTNHFCLDCRNSFTIQGPYLRDSHTDEQLATQLLKDLND